MHFGDDCTQSLTCDVNDNNSMSFKKKYQAIYFQKAQEISPPNGCIACYGSRSKNYKAVHNPTFCK